MCDAEDVMEVMQITPTDVVKWCVIAVIVIGALCALSVKIYKQLELYRAKMNLIDDKNEMIQCHEDDILGIKEMIKNNETTMNVYKAVLVEILHDSISQRCRYYLSIGYVPEDEVEDFNRKFQMYQSNLNGNHGLEKKVAKANMLPIHTNDNEDIENPVK